MASQQASREIPQAGQTQPVSDAVMQEALDNSANTQSAQKNTTHTSQATDFLQQTGEQVKNLAQGAGEQVKNIAQGAADAVKNTLGMNTDNTNNNISTDAGAGTTATHPSSLTTDHRSNPANNISLGTTNTSI